MNRKLKYGQDTRTPHFMRVNLIVVVTVAENHYLSFPRRRESNMFGSNGSFGAMDPRLRGGDSFSTTVTK